MAPLTKLLLLAGAANIAGAAALAPGGQQPLGADYGGISASGSNFKCDLPPVLDPAKDGLPSAESLFSSHEAMLRQVKRHQAIVRVPSICYDDLGGFDEDKRWAPFSRLHDVLAKTYPIVHERAKVEKVNRFGLIYTINGTDQDTKPILLAAHQDVVPVADASTWTHPPFEAFFDGEWIWGRGSSDDKNSLTALLSAVETLLSNPAYAPSRTVILAFGFDEECSGWRGAGTIAGVLERRYGRDGIDLILDEGGMGFQPLGAGTLYALPAVTEKSAVDVWFELHVQGGHSSIPFPHTGIGIVAEIASALEAHPYAPAIVEGSPVYNHLVCQARYSDAEVPWVGELLRKGRLDELAERVAGTDPMTRFLIQTSQAVDMIEGGQKINAMPEVVRLGVNYRIAPHEDVSTVQRNIVKYIKPVVAKYNLTVKAFGDDEAYEEQHVEPSSGSVDYKGLLVVKSTSFSRATPISPTSGPVWDIFSGTIQHSFAFDNGTVVPVGQIMTGNTDTRHYLDLSPHIYRWTPSRQRGSDHIHTIDERVNMKSHLEIVRFYYDLIRNFNSASA